MEIVSKYGSEPATQGLRVFADKLRGLETISNVYYYKPDTLAIVLSDYGQIDVVNECEAIYELNRTSCFKDNETLFSITYLPIMYPQGYASAADFLRHAEKFYSSGKYKSGKNFIYFDESDYSRPASKNEFMLSVIDDKFTNKDFTVNLQPLVHTSNRKIFGAELLLRLSDEYRKIVFNADQLIKVAAANGKIGLISSALLEYVGELYDQYGLSIFKVYGFERLTINTDYSYLSDSNLTEKITELFTKHHVPKGFLGFEITEKDIYDHYDDMKKFMNTLSALGVILICDRYSGEFLSFDRLKELNVTEFKIDRLYTRFIDTDRQKYTMVRSLLEAAKGSDITAGLIGVENMEQYKMIHEINNDSYLQGYAFFKPMDKGSLVDVVRKTNTALKGAK
jgi:EAL domain-containing protein (putative c-di-GMP-specific phosphodiesterase class I)